MFEIIEAVKMFDLSLLMNFFKKLEINESQYCKRGCEWHYGIDNLNLNLVQIIFTKRTYEMVEWYWVHDTEILKVVLVRHVISMPRHHVKWSVVLKEKMMTHNPVFVRENDFSSISISSHKSIRLSAKYGQIWHFQN